MSGTDKEKLKQQNTIRFIEATRELIDENGLENLSIRKIADRAGFHNSTIYLYFKDVNQLILLASLKHFSAYSRALSEQSKKKVSPTENFFAVWAFFGDTAFRQAQIFYNFFFGKHSDDLTSIMEQYYDLFPDEREDYSEEISDMFYARNIEERCRRFLKPLIAENTRVTADNFELINDIIVSCLKMLLEKKCQMSDLDAEMLNQELQKMLACVVLA